jgi:hypothetical protein
VFRRSLVHILDGLISTIAAFILGSCSSTRLTHTNLPAALCVLPLGHPAASGWCSAVTARGA